MALPGRFPPPIKVPQGQEERPRPPRGKFPSPFPTGQRIGDEPFRPSINPIIKEAIQRERERTKEQIFLPGPYEISQAPGIPTWESFRIQELANMGPVPDYVPVGAPRDEYHLPADWSATYRTRVLGPNNEPLPSGATGWTRYGQPYYGGDDPSLKGDFKSWWNSIWGNMHDPTVQQPAYTAFNQEWLDRVTEMLDEEPTTIGINPAYVKAIGSVFEEIVKGIREFGNKARNVQPGSSIGEQTALALSYTGRAAGNVIKIAGDAVNLPVEAFEKTFGAIQVKNRMLAA